MGDYSVLDKIKSPAELTYLSYGQLERLCGELRRLLIEGVSATGGHLASNLGVVELTVALHRVFHSPVDQIVWDVGHQSYVHKILTGRKERFSTLRQEGGLSGFPRAGESVHDSFLAGHASTSIAVADGIARAKRLRGEEGHAVAVIGDGAFTGGMAFEGLNNAARGENRNLIILLNDNKMSISKNNGSIGTYLANLRTNESYFRLKDFTKSMLQAIPVLGDGMVEVISSSKSKLKNVLYQSSFFEDLGFVHMGPVDGHNLPMLCTVLERAKSLERPVFIHVCTTKGKGYDFAERNPGQYHGVSKFDPAEGNGRLPPRDNYSEVFGKYLTALAMRDDRICAVTAAMKYGTGLNYFSRQFKGSGRFVDVGIAEQYAATFSAALASKRMLPVCAIYSTFLQRAYDQLLHDCAIEPRHVVLAVDRAGLVGEDGETHQGLFDCAYLSTIPGAVIYSPTTYRELKRCLRRALYEEDGLVAVRYPRGAQPQLKEPYAAEHRDHLHLPGEGLLLVSYGREWAEVCAAAERLRGSGIRPGLLKLTRVFPLDPDAVAAALSYSQILFVEEAAGGGGIGEHFFAALALRGYRGGCTLRAVEGFVSHATVGQQLRALGLDAASVEALAKKIVLERKEA